MASRSVRLATALALAAVSVGTWFAIGSGARDASQQVPLIDDTPNLQNSASNPQVVQNRAEKLVRQAIAQLRRIGHAKPSRAAGCQPTDTPGSLGPPAPTSVTARIIGRHVEAVVRFAKLPTTPVCRPWAIMMTTFGKPIRAGGHFPWNQYFQLAGPVGRGVIRLPYYSTAPYELWVRSGTMQNRRSKLIKVKLSCPATGCLPGKTSGQDADLPRFPLRGISTAQMQQSFSDGEAAIARSAPFMRYRVSCTRTSSCTVTFTDPLFPRQPYRVRYTIAGEQQPGCWYVSDHQELDPPPFQDAFARAPLAGCVSWLT